MPARTPPTTSSGTATDQETAQSFDTLVHLLNNEQNQALAELRASFEDDAVWLEALNRLLPTAIAQHQDNPIFPTLLRPVVEASIEQSIKSNLEMFSEMLMPPVERSIQRTVRSTFGSLVQSLNHSLEYSFNVPLRLRAWRTGTPFSEVVLAEILRYRVVHVFLIEKESGLLLQQVADDDARLEDGDMISSMLSAINDFAKDSFRVSESQSLNRISIDDLTLVIHQGRYSYLAALVQGTLPSDLDEHLLDIQRVLELKHRDAFEHYDGNSAHFEATKDVLDDALVSDFREPSTRPNPVLLVLFALVMLGILWFGFSSMRQARQWRTLVAQVEVLPGVTVLESHRSPWSALRRRGGFALAGLRDPLAQDVAAFIGRQASINPQRIRQHWEAFYSPELQPQRDQQAQQQRLQQILARLEPPAGVDLSLSNNFSGPEGFPATSQLRIAGLRFPEHLDWLERSAAVIAVVPELSGYQLSNPLASLRPLLANLRQQYVFFQPDSLIGYGDAQLLAQHQRYLRNQLKTLERAAELSRYPLHLQLVSRAGWLESAKAQGEQATQTEETTQALYALLQARAESIANTLALSSLSSPLKQASLRLEPSPQTIESILAAGALAVPPPASSNDDARATLGHIYLEVYP